MTDRSTDETALVWHVTPTDKWPEGDLLGDEPTILVPEFDDDELSEGERNIRNDLREMGGIRDGILCYGGLARLPADEEVDVFAVHEALVDELCEEGGAFGEMMEVLAEDGR